MTQTDEELLAAIGQRDVVAFDCFYRRHAERAHVVAMHVLRNDDLAQEVVQDAFMNLWFRPVSYVASRGAPLPWLCGAVRHRAIDCWRREQRRPHCVHDAEQYLSRASASGDVEESVIARERCTDVRRDLQGLPETQGTAIALSFYGEMSHTEIATRLDVPVGTVKGRIRLGMDRLRVAPSLDPAGGLMHPHPS